jgi:hypothetical protein
LADEDASANWARDNAFIRRGPNPCGYFGRSYSLCSSTSKRSVTRRLLAGAESRRTNEMPKSVEASPGGLSHNPSQKLTAESPGRRFTNRYINLPREHISKTLLSLDWLRKTVFCDAGDEKREEERIVGMFVRPNRVRTESHPLPQSPCACANVRKHSSAVRLGMLRPIPEKAGPRARPVGVPHQRN